MSAKYNLSAGSLEIIMQGGKYPNPIMQILASKRINAGAADKERYRVVLSDSKNTISFAMLTTQVRDQVGPDVLEMYSVIQIDKYITSVIDNKAKGVGDARVLLILELKLIASGAEVGEKIGSPVQLTNDSSSSAPKTNVSNTNTNGTSTNSSVVYNKPATSNNPTPPMDTSENLSNQMTHPISSLSPYHNKWVIKARVTNKSSIRTWSNSRGEGKLFSLDLCDESGEIRLTGFKDMVDKFYDYVQVDKVYFISKCQLKSANKQYSTLKNDYEMTMTPETIIQECHDVDSSAIPQTKYDFVTIDKIANTEPNTIVDIIGVVKSVSDLQTFQAKSTGRELKKKDVTLVDQSKTAVALTLWGSEAESFDGTNNPVLVIKGARVTEFGGGKSLSTVSSSNIKVNPEMKECYRIRGWYDGEGANMDATNISARSGAGGFNTPWMSFKEVQDQNLGNADKGDYYQVMGTILLIRSENAMYKACPTPECNKKVIDLENGMYRCEKCNREFPNFKYRLLASMNVGDWSGNQWMSMFSSEVEKVLGQTSQEIGEQVEQNSEAMANIVDKCHFRQFILKCRAKMETYNDESRLKTVCIKVDPINYEEYNNHLIERIQQLIA
ncbi:unnamed protein product [Phaedon cochleariae]|uniref:Replication protein A subunit n=1 Tax=Phaedon cochleariae TaxID=80249 RepID=A0A9N9SD58_PHACE|nr:unnamed protein product [Phaedon cochleariae]